MARALPAVLALLALASGAGAQNVLEDLDRDLYETSRGLAPPHPVTGKPVLNPISEAWEVDLARSAWGAIRSQAEAIGIPVDPAGPRRERVRAVFERLVAVAHRPGLPWEVHLLGLTEANAYTPGGGIVLVLDGTFGAMIAAEDDDELAAVLAHEIAHVTMLHPPAGLSERGLGALMSADARSPFFQAAYTAAQEAEADRLGILYMALAGFDPAAASRVWERAHREHGSSAARAQFLNDHPLNDERTAATAEAARLVAGYRVAGQRNPRWREIQSENALFPHAEEQGYRPGAGVARAAAAALETYTRYLGTRDEKRRREELAARLAKVQILRAFEGRTADERWLYLDVYNGTDRSIGELAIAIHYTSDQEVLATDESCTSEVAIPPGATQRVACDKQSIPDAKAFVAEIVDVGWR